MTVVWATAIFRSYVYGQQLTVVTDHRPLKYLLNNVELTSKFARWVAILQDLDIRVIHRPGSEQPADHLSRYPTQSTTDATGARMDFDADDVDPIAPVVAATDDPQLNALTAKLRDTHNIYGVSSCFALAIHAQPDQPDPSGTDEMMRLGLTDLELRRHRLTPLLPPVSAEQPKERTALWLNDVPRPLPLQHRAWVVIELCGGIAAGLQAMTDQGQTISRYIYVDNCARARQCAAERARMLVEKRPQLFRRHAIKHAFETWPQDILQLSPTHLHELQLQPDESVIVIAGTPCQDWSAAGSQRGEAGVRGSITPIVADVIANLQQRGVPTFYLLENVPPQLKGDPTGEQLYERLCAILRTPVMSDATRFDSFAHRLRLYWTNLAPTTWLQSTLDQVHRSPRRYLHHILPTHLKPLKPTGHRATPYYPCGEVDEPRKTLPTIMATVGSYAYRDQGPGMLFDLNTADYVEPPPRVREIAMGHPPDITAHPANDERTRIRLVGNSFDMAALNHLLTTAFLLNSRLQEVVSAAVALPPPPPPPHHMLGPLSRSQATQRYSAFANRELTLWGHRLGTPLGMGGGA
eukprot:9486139-Pyramimonas_sp.AAC.1